MEKQNIAEQFQRMIKCFWNDIWNLRWALLGIAGYFLMVHFLFGQFCPSMIFFDFPCPGCGMTRAAWLVFAGRWAQAWNLQPPVFGWILLVLVWMCDRYLCRRKSSARKNWMAIFLVLLLLVTLGLYVFRIFTGFPVELL